MKPVFKPSSQPISDFSPFCFYLILQNCFLKRTILGKSVNLKLHFNYNEKVFSVNKFNEKLTQQFLLLINLMIGSCWKKILDSFLGNRQWPGQEIEPTRQLQGCQLQINLYKKKYDHFFYVFYLKKQ